jgi:hypothetical protein
MKTRAGRAVWVVFGQVGLFFLALSVSVGCTPRQSPDPDPAQIAKQAALNPLSPEEADAMLGDVGENWLYGNGLGETAIAVGSVVAFPPAAIYWLGNVALSAAGYEPIGVSTVLPEEEKAQWNGIYDGISGAPGRVSAAIAGKEFITREHAKERLDKYLPPVPAPEVESKNVAHKESGQQDTTP